MFFVHALSNETENDIDSKQRSFEKNPGVAKNIAQVLWFAFVILLTYKNYDLSAFFILNRFTYLLSLFVSMRDGGFHLSCVEYNIQTNNLVGMISCIISLWVVMQQISFAGKCPEQSALGVLSSYQAFQSTFSYIYCRPLPVARTKWDVIVEEYLMYPILMLSMIQLEDVAATTPITTTSGGGGGGGGGIPRSYTTAVYAILIYKFILLFLDYHKNTSTLQKTITNPIKHVFTESLANVETKVTPPPLERDVWRIYGNVYDMTNYVNIHPGGKEAIMLGANRDDCTSLFQSYHPFNIQHAKAVLKKYRIDNDNNNDTTSINSTKNGSTKTANDNNGQLVSTTVEVTKHENDLFYDILCRRVEKTLREKYNIDPIKDRTPTILRYSYYVLLLIAITWSCIAHCRGSVLGSFMLGVVGWLMGAIGHDGGHFAVSHNPLINDIAVWGMMWLCNPIMWQHQHTYAHHCYTNQYEHDPDLHHFDMLLRYHKKSKAHPIYKQQTNRIFVLFAFVFTALGECHIIPWRFIQERSLYGTVGWTDRNRSFRTILFLFHFAIYGFIIMGIPFFVHERLLTALISCFTPVLVSGILFALCAQIGHITEHCITVDISKRHPIARESWAANQIETTNDFAPQSSLWHLLGNGLSLQIEHHLFPGLNHCHLQLIQPTVEQTCKEYNVNYKKYDSWYSVMQATFDYLHTMVDAE